MKKFFTHIFLLGLIILVATGCPDPDNATNTNNEDFPSGNVYFLGKTSFMGPIYQLSGPEYKITTLIDFGRSPNKLSNSSLIYVADDGIALSTGNFATSTIILERDKTSPWVWNGDFDNVTISEKYQRIAYENGFTQSIYVVDFQGTPKWEIIAKDSKEYMANPEFTNDGKLLFAGVNNKLGILEMDLETGDISELIEGSNNPSQPSISADGSKIAFTMNNNIWTANRDGSNMQQFTNDAKNRDTPEWSPDGKWIANLQGSYLSFIRISDSYEVLIHDKFGSPYTNFLGVQEKKLFWVNY